MVFKPGRPKPPIWRILLYMVLATGVIILFGVLRTYM